MCKLATMLSTSRETPTRRWSTFSMHHKSVFRLSTSSGIIFERLAFRSVKRIRQPVSDHAQLDVTTVWTYSGRAVSASDQHMCKRTRRRRTTYTDSKFHGYTLDGD